MRNIKDILKFRRDLSPFLVHLTRDSGSRSAKEVFEKILGEKRLIAGDDEVSDARFGASSVSDRARFFRAVCFTETPLDEIHCLLDINNRAVNLQPYGLVFVKKRLQLKCVSPVVYIQNCNGDKNPLFRALCSMIKDHADEAARFLPLISVFGDKVQPTNASFAITGDVDFSWEREWRQVFEETPMEFSNDDIFVGVCPDGEIKYFEDQYNLPFVDPRMNMKWYATKLIEARKKHKMKCSVV